jgi:hypothetical protein
VDGLRHDLAVFDEIGVNAVSNAKVGVHPGRDVWYWFRCP